MTDPRFDTDTRLPRPDAGAAPRPPPGTLQYGNGDAKPLFRGRRRLGSARAFLFTTLGLLGLLQLATSALMLNEAQEDYRRAETIVLVDRISARLVSAAPDLGLERERSAVLFTQPGPASRADLDLLVERRLATGRALAAARADLAGYRPELVVQLDEITVALAQLRARLDAEFSKPRAGRDAVLGAFWFAEFTGYFERVVGVVEELGRLRHGEDFVFGSLNEARIGAMRFRRAFGDASALFAAQIAAGHIADPATLNEIRRLQTRRDELWKALGTQVRLLGSWKLSMTLAAVEPDLLSGLSRVQTQILSAWTSRQVSPLDATGYARETAVGGKALAEFTGEISRAANEHAAGLRSEAMVRLVLGVSLLLISLLLVAGTAWLVSRRIVAPLEELAVAAAAVAGGREGLRVVERGVDEVRAVSWQFNRMNEARAEAMRKLSESERRFQTIFQMTPDSTIILSLPELRHVAVNDEWVREFGMSRGEVIGRTFEEIGLKRYETENATVEAPLAALATNRSHFEIWLTNRHKGLQAYEITARQVDIDGKQYMVSQARNVTSRRRAVQELVRLNRELEQRVSERTAELSGSLKEMESFAYSISHDLRAPLRHIDGFATLLAAEESATLGENGQKLLQKISRAANRMGALIDDLLTFSRTGRHALVMGRVDTAKMIDEVREQIAPETEGRNIEWMIGPLPPVAGDAALLRQVWINLLANAVKFTRGRDPARIEIGTLPPEAGMVSFYVRDNGAGFDARYADKLFGVFQRLHGETEFEGTGIGLAIVARVLQRHGGRVWAESEVGKGATFFFQLKPAA